MFHKTCSSFKKKENQAGYFGDDSLMADMLHSIMTKLTAGFVILVILITGLTFFFSVGTFTEKIQESNKHELLALASITAADLNGDEIAK